MSLINFYDYIKTEKTINPNYAIHGIKLPFRMCCAAPSGSGKSNGILNLIVALDKSFHEIIYCIKSGDEPLIQHLENKLGSGVQIYEGGEVPLLESFSRKNPNTGRLERRDKKQRLIIFDDLILDRAANKIIAEYYVKARKLGFSMVYISQSYYQIPKMIRDNCQLFMLGRNLLKKDLRMILNVFPTELTLDRFSDLYNELTAEPMTFIIIDVEKRTIRKNIVSEPIKL
jgi:hypothetical protein